MIFVQPLWLYLSLSRGSAPQIESEEATNWSNGALELRMRTVGYRRETQFESTFSLHMLRLASFILFPAAGMGAVVSSSYLCFLLALFSDSNT